MIYDLKEPILGYKKADVFKILDDEKVVGNLGEYEEIKTEDGKTESVFAVKYPRAVIKKENIINYQEEEW